MATISFADVSCQWQKPKPLKTGLARRPDELHVSCDKAEIFVELWRAWIFRDSIDVKDNPRLSFRIIRRSGPIGFVLISR